MKTKISVCIVEDCFIQSTVLKKILESEGYRVSGVYRSGEDVVDNFNSDQTDIYLMDINLKGAMNGFDTANFIRQNSEVPILFVSGLKNKDIENRVSKVTSSAMEIKPIYKEAFLNSLDTLVGSNQLVAH